MSDDRLASIGLKRSAVSTTRRTSASGRGAADPHVDQDSLPARGHPLRDAQLAARVGLTDDVDLDGVDVDAQPRAPQPISDGQRGAQPGPHHLIGRRFRRAPPPSAMGRSTTVRESPLLDAAGELPDHPDARLSARAPERGAPEHGAALAVEQILEARGAHCGASLLAGGGSVQLDAAALPGTATGAGAATTAPRGRRRSARARGGAWRRGRGAGAGRPPSGAARSPGLRSSRPARRSKVSASRSTCQLLWWVHQGRVTSDGTNRSRRPTGGRSQSGFSRDRGGKRRRCRSLPSAPGRRPAPAHARRCVPARS